MRLPTRWTGLMALAIAGYATVLFAIALGGGWLAWILALPAMFVGLQLLGLPIVMLCELAERIGLLPRTSRPLFDEILLVSCLVGFGFLVLSISVAGVVAAFFGGMYCLRVVARKSWRPGDAEELGA